jgi:peptidoglycan/xylan/chitin deacetylase (PgdA/CDA1 family)
MSGRIPSATLTFSWRRLLKLSIAALLYYSGVLALLRRLRGRRQMLVLGLHRVLSAEQQPVANSLPAMVLTEDTFVRLLSHLRRSFHVLSLPDFERGVRPGSGRPALLITFDDGWRDNCEVAFPRLRDAGLPAAIFLATGFIGTRTTFWVERLVRAARLSSGHTLFVQLARALHIQHETADLSAVVERLKHLPARERDLLLEPLLSADAFSSADAMLDWSQVAAMRDAGIAFAAHTVTHPLLTYEDDAAVAAELSGSRRAVEREAGVPQVLSFAYPNGTWDARVRSLVDAAGFRFAFTTEPGWHSFGDDPLAIRRVLLHEGAVTGLWGRFSPALFSFNTVFAGVLP